MVFLQERCSGNYANQEVYKALDEGHDDNDDDDDDDDDTLTMKGFSIVDDTRWKPLHVNG